MASIVVSATRDLALGRRQTDTECAQQSCQPLYGSSTFVESMRREPSVINPRKLLRSVLRWNMGAMAVRPITRLNARMLPDEP